VVEDPTLGAKELAKNIKTKYKVDVPYGGFIQVKC
jgi:hypothetical protein